MPDADSQHLLPARDGYETCPTCWQPVPVPQRGDHDYGLPLRAAAPHDAGPAREPTAEQQERSKWRANERADRAEGIAGRLADALATIRDQYGQVCDDFELCEHRACRSSYAAWHVAEAALKESPHG